MARPKCQSDLTDLWRSSKYIRFFWPTVKLPCVLAVQELGWDRQVHRQWWILLQSSNFESEDTSLQKFMKIRLRTFIVASVALLSLGLAACSCLADDKPTASLNGPAMVIPQIAQVGKFQVGVTTMEQLEAAFGKGRPFTGGHANGAREWYCKEAGWYVYADGFDYNGIGRVVDSFEISAVRRNVGSTFHSDSKFRKMAAGMDLIFLGSISSGQERSKVMDLLLKKGNCSGCVQELGTLEREGLRAY